MSLRFYTREKSNKEKSKGINSAIHMGISGICSVTRTYAWINWPGFVL